MSIKVYAEGSRKNGKPIEFKKIEISWIGRDKNGEALTANKFSLDAEEAQHLYNVLTGKEFIAVNFPKSAEPHNLDVDYVFASRETNNENT